MAHTDSDHLVEFQVSKKGPFGTPSVRVIAPASASLDKVAVALQKMVTSNSDLRTKLGLKGCGGCASSGFHVDIWNKFENVLQADLRKF
jgi:hypothetical protein